MVILPGLHKISHTLYEMSSLARRLHISEINVCCLYWVRQKLPCPLSSLELVVLNTDLVKYVGDVMVHKHIH